MELLATGVLRRRRTGDINDIGDDWWAPAHSSWGVVFRRRCDDLTYEAHQKHATWNAKYPYLLLIQPTTTHKLQDKGREVGSNPTS